MTVVHSVAPAQRTGESSAPTPRPAPVDDFRRQTLGALEVLRSAESITNHPGRACEGSADCVRPGALAVITEDGTSAVCGLHALNLVFSTSSGPIALVKAGD